MTKHHFCTVKHDPPHSYGDCFRAAVACLLNRKHIEDVPHFYHDGCDGETGIKRLTDWLHTKQLHPFVMYFSEETLDEVTGLMQIMNPGVRYILTGSTQNENHSVVYAGDTIVHDPAWFSAKLVGRASNGFWSVLTVVPLHLLERAK